MERLRARARGARRAHLRVVPAQQAQRVAGLQDPRQRVRARPLPQGAVSAVATAWTCSPSSPIRRRPIWRARSTSPATAWKAVVVGRRGRRARAASAAGPGAIVACDADPEGAWAFCRALRKRDMPVVAAAAARQRRPARRPRAARRPVRRLLPHPVPPDRARGPAAPPVLAGGDGERSPSSSSTAALALNLETYQASIDGRPLDLTYMEYELLQVPRPEPGQGVHPRDPAQPGVGLRVLRRRPHGRRAHPAPAGQARRGARQPDPDRALGRLPLRPDAAGAA